MPDLPGYSGAHGGFTAKHPLFLLAYSGPHRRYLLRQGAYHHTATHVLKYGMQRGNYVFAYEYYVAGQRSRECGPEEWQAYPMLGQRCYVRFAFASPGA